ncbi:acyl-CoA synthetase [Alcanivoracaceae bacterium MT1]
MTIRNGIGSYQDVEAIERGIADLELPDSTYQMIQASCKKNPGAPALSFFMQTSQHHAPMVWSYQDLLRNINQTANFLDHIGADKNTVIAYILPNLPETHCVIWGGQATGIVCAINPLLEADSMAELLNAANATVLVTLAPFPGTDLWPKVYQAVMKTPAIKHVALVSLADHLRGLKEIAGRALQKKEEITSHGLKGIKGSLKNCKVYDFNTETGRQPSTFLRSNRKISPDDISSYFCTGGTTGTPKLAMRTHHNEVANAWSASQFLGEGVGRGKNIFCGLPLFHVNAVLVTGLLPFSKGAHVVLGTPQGYRGDGVVSRFWEIVEKHRINFFSGVPTLYSALLQNPIKQHDISSLEYGLCGAAPLPREVFRKFQESTGLKILEGYGLTEGTCVSSVNPPLGNRRLGSIGLRVPGQKMKAVILDDDGNYLRDAGIDEVGVLAISGANVFSGYKLTEQNKGLWIHCGDGLRWMNTGDLGKQDEDGYFWLTGRKKELIIRGGHNIDPSTIEEPLHRHPAVQAAAAIGRPDPYAGELPVAYVQLNPGQSATPDELMMFVQEFVPERAARPKHIRIIDQLPLTGVGKVFKPALKHREIEDVMTAALRDAGLSVDALTVREEKARGVIINIVPIQAADDAAIRECLALFPFTVEIGSLATEAI